MTPKQVAWALLVACCRQEKVCKRCAKLGIGVNKLTFLTAVEGLHKKSSFPWPLAYTKKLLKAVVCNHTKTIAMFPEEMRHDLALLLLHEPLIRRQTSVEGVIKTFAPLAEKAGIDGESLKNLIVHVWRTRTQEQVNEEQEQRREERSFTQRHRGAIAIDLDTILNESVN